ncbi:MAG: hypothetical protein EU536_04305 [Promethearchaeota archaeon]|nr:MAG: hypothetical protein EU536_04305 [Candidatus Lokiarchaeota archaeon]
MIYWALLLHIYQPPFQSYDILQKIDRESYSPVMDVFLQHPGAKFTLNINGSLTEFLNNYKCLDTLEKIRALAQKDQLRFTGSGMYHPILPFLPPSEVLRQIHLNETYNNQILGSKFGNAKGFFPPELAISKGVLDILAQSEVKWVLVSGIACPSTWPTDFYYTYKNVPILFRDDIISNEISFKKIAAEDFLPRLKDLFEEDDYYVITAMDGETFGHHIENYEESFLGAVLDLLPDDPEVQMIFIDDILMHFNKKIEIVPINSSWSTAPEHLENKNPYPLWADPKNKFHEVLGNLQKLAIELFHHLERHSAQIPEDHLEFYRNARTSLDKGENSDGAWWAGAFYFSDDLIYRSSQYLVRSVINAYKALFSVALSRDEITEVQHLHETFRLSYSNLLQLLRKNTEERSRFKPFLRRINDLTSL